ncbi:MAG: CDP-alcohol phosphatidyltransferase family protein [Planctomycetota bacterium]
MGVSFRELRERCQLPVRENNDVAGLIYGDRVSLLFTKVLVDRGWSPDVASYAMLVCGVVGSLALAIPGWVSVIGAFVVVLYYVFDCVDGEVARWRGIQNLDWTWLDFLFHLIVKPFMFFFLGVGLYLELGHVWIFGLSFSALISTLFLKVLKDMTFPIFCKKILLNPYLAEDKAYANLRREIEPTPPPKSKPDGEVFRLRPSLSTVRCFLTNFDIAILLLAIAALIDVALLGSFELPLIGAVNLRLVLLGFYAIVLPIDYLDWLQTFIRQKRFRTEMATLLGAADEFRSEPR